MSKQNFIFMMQTVGYLEKNNGMGPPNCMGEKSVKMKSFLKQNLLFQKVPLQKKGLYVVLETEVDKMLRLQTRY